MKGFGIVSKRKLEALVEARLQERLSESASSDSYDLLKRQSDIAMLQAQINPHFLYNALECIRGQALICNVPSIADTAQALSGYFRYSISLHEDIVSLRDELLNVENYMKIQKYRFEDRFDLISDFRADDPLLYTTALPKLTLQPLVENAILHGLSSVTKSDAAIRISIETYQKHVSIHIIDNGVGMSQSQLDLILERLESNDPLGEKNKHGIALWNVHRRIKYLFGEGYGLNISSEQGIGTDIEIHIPHRTPEDMRAHLNP